MVCISPSPSNPKVLRAASKMAQAFRTDFTALFVESSDTKDLDPEEKENLEKNMNLAKDLKANVVVSYGDDIAYQ